MPGTGDEDPADFADKALCAGISHLELMHGIRQEMLNLIAVALFHAFEQQAISFHRELVAVQSLLLSVLTGQQIPLESPTVCVIEARTSVEAYLVVIGSAQQLRLVAVPVLRKVYREVH